MYRCQKVTISDEEMVTFFLKLHYLLDSIESEARSDDFTECMSAKCGIEDRLWQYARYAIGIVISRRAGMVSVTCVSAGTEKLCRKTMVG